MVMAKIKVGKDVIDFIKSQGMSATLKRVGSMSATERSRDAEYTEGVRRMYGDRRFQDATRSSSSTAPKYGSADAARSSVIKAAATPRMVDGSKRPPLKSPNVTVKDTRPGATGGSTFKASSVNAPRKSSTPSVTAKQVAAAKKYVPATGSNFMSNAPIAPKPVAKPKGPATKITPAAKKAAQSAASWRY